MAAPRDDAPDCPERLPAGRQEVREIRKEFYVERVAGIGPAWRVWKTRALPLCYTRKRADATSFGGTIEDEPGLRQIHLAWVVFRWLSGNPSFCYDFDMKSDSFATIQSKLLEELPMLRRRFGVRQFGVFGSAASDALTDDSDIDILVEFDRPVGFFKYLALEQELTHLLGRRIDLVTKPALKSRIKDQILATTRYV